MASSSSPDWKIPVVDMGALAVGQEEEAASPAEWQRVAQGLHDALSGIGFVYLSNHGIADAQINNILNDSSIFFKLDQQTKLRYKSGKYPSHGYVEVDRQKLDKTGQFSELRESYDMRIQNLEDVFPDSEVPQLRPSVTAFIASCKTLSYRVLTALALGLGLERDFFVANHRGLFNSTPNFAMLRINHYQPVPSTVPENAIRCGAHTDFGCITLLFQDSMGGLQVRSKDGKWVDAKPIPGTILINAGDLLQIWTANKFVATEHRVIIPEEEVARQASRYSAAFFVDPDPDVLVRPIDGSTSPPPITAGEHFINMHNKTYNL